MRPCVHAMPSRYPNAHPGTMLIHATQPGMSACHGPYRSRSTAATTSSGGAATHTPIRRSIATPSGVSAVITR